jgi:myo-inositol 2-dehydrogenase / D-chiro-inositol 1-dehydrogenase
MNCQRISRRAFVSRTTAAVAVAPMIVPSRVLGLGAAVAPSNRITIGYIGTGRQCIYANIPGFLREPDAQSVAVCDVDSWRMNKAREAIESFYARREPDGDFKGCAMYGDWRELLARKDIDAVMISTPDHWHVIQAIAALKAGKDVACEKPLTRNIAEGRLLCDTVANTRRVFRTDSEFRSSRSMHWAAQLVRNGKIGRLERIISATPKDGTLPEQPAAKVPAELNYDMWLGPAPEKPYTEKRVHPRNKADGRPGWICIRDYADGMLANWGAHLNDIAMWANNTEQTGPVSIEATGKFPPQGNLWDVVQEFEAIFTFANGVRLTCKTDKPYLRFEGTTGWVQVRYPNEMEASDEALLRWKPGADDVVLPLKSSEKRDFLDAVKSRKQPLYTAEGGHRTASLSHLAIAAIESGRKLKWDPEKEKVIGDDEAMKLLAPKPLRAPWKLG